MEVFAFVLFGVMTGYFLSDIILNIIHRQNYNKTVLQSSEIIFHHIICILAFCISVYEFRYVGAILVTLLAELHNVVLHFRSLILLTNLKKNFSQTFKFVVFLNIFTLFTFRTVPTFYIIYKFFLISNAPQTSVNSIVLTLIWFSLLILFLFKIFMAKRLIVSDFFYN